MNWQSALLGHGLTQNIILFLVARGEENFKTLDFLCIDINHAADV